MQLSAHSTRIRIWIFCHTSGENKSNPLVPGGPVDAPSAGFQNGIPFRSGAPLGNLESTTD